MKWTAILAGDNFDLQTFAEVFAAGDPRVEPDDGRFVLHSAAFDDCTDVTEVQAEAEPLVTRMNGAVRASDPSFRGVALSGQYDNDNGLHAIFLADTLSMRGGAQGVVIGGDAGPPPVPRARVWASLADSDPAVADALRLLGSLDQLDFVALYKLFEIVRDDAGGGKGIEEKGWATRDEISAFTAAANRPDVSGDEARHARMGGTPPKRAFTIDESRSFVLTLVQRWLESK